MALPDTVLPLQLAAHPSVSLTMLSVSSDLVRHLEIFKPGISNIQERRGDFPMLAIRNITMQGVSTLLTATMDNLQIEKKISEGINNLVDIDILSVIITISLIIPISCFEMVC